MYLVGTLPDGTSFRHPVPPGCFRVGRGRENTIVLSHLSISRHHAEIERTAANRLRVRDLNSTNGTRVNGELISEAEISLPCQILFGDLPCALEVDARAPIIVPKPRVEEGFDDTTVTPWPLPAPPPSVGPGSSRAIVRTATLLGGIAAVLWCLWGPGGARETALAKPPSMRATPARLPLAKLSTNHPAPAPAATPAPIAEAEPPANPPAGPAPAQASPDSQPFPGVQPAIPVATPIPTVRAAIAVTRPATPVAATEETPEVCACEDDDPDTGTPPEAVPVPEPMVVKAETPEPNVENAPKAIPVKPIPRAEPAKPNATQADPIAENRSLAPAPLSPPAPKLMLAFSNEKVTLGAPPAFSNQPFSPQPQGRTIAPAATKPIPRAVPVLGSTNTLILGDSLSLCGFGPRLDQHFRESGFSKTTYTYMACGTIPLTWLKAKPYASAKTLCGFWTIETDPTGGVAKQVKDVYGMKHGYKPAAHPIPKLEDLLAQTHPEVLVIQTGTNFFSLFHGNSQLEHQVPELRRQLQPFLDVALGAGSPVRKIYWVGAPTSGAAPPEVQDYVFHLLESELPPLVTIIDSRTLISYPYHHMEPDHEHFTGEDMEVWADKVYEKISADLKEHGLPSQKEVEANRLLTPKGTPKQEKPIAPDEVVVTAQLTYKSTPLTPEQFKPYQESLVSFVYKVQSIQHGEYNEKQILVMRPAHIGLQPQPLDRFKIGKTYKLRLHELEGSVWSTIKSKDDSGLIDLIPYIEVDDETKLPSRSI